MSLRPSEMSSTGSDNAVPLNIVPDKSQKNGFVNTFSKQLCEFLKNAYEWKLSAAIETMRRDENNLKIYKILEEVLSDETNRMRGTIKKKISGVDKRAELASLVYEYVNRTTLPTSSSSTSSHTHIDISAQILRELCDSLEFVSTSTEQEQKKKRSILTTLQDIVIEEWRQAIFFYAVRSVKFCNSKHLLELKLDLTLDDDDGSRFYSSSSSSFSSRSSKSHRLKNNQHSQHFPQHSIYQFALIVIKIWIQLCKNQAKIIDSGFVSKDYQKLDMSGRQNTTISSSSTSIFSSIFVHIFTNELTLKNTLRQATRETLQRYAEDYVFESPSAKEIIDEREKMWFEKAKALSPKLKLTEDAKHALKHGISAAGIISLAEDEGFYFGSRKQRTMYMTYEERIKSKRMEKLLEKHLKHMDTKLDHHYSKLKSESLQQDGVEGVVIPSHSHFSHAHSHNSSQSDTVNHQNNTTINNGLVSLLPSISQKIDTSPISSPTSVLLPPNNNIVIAPLTQQQQQHFPQNTTVRVPTHYQQNSVGNYTGEHGNHVDIGQQQQQQPPQQQARQVLQQSRDNHDHSTNLQFQTPLSPTPTYAVQPTRDRIMSPPPPKPYETRHVSFVSQIPTTSSLEQAIPDDKHVGNNDMGKKLPMTLNLSRSAPRQVYENSSDESEDNSSDGDKDSDKYSWDSESDNTSDASSSDNEWAL